MILRYLIEAEIKKDIKKTGKVIGYIKLDRSDKNLIRITDIEMNISGTGLGTKVIKAIMSEADKKREIVTLTSNAMRGKVGQKKNRELYLRLGFIKNTGKNKLKTVGYEEFYQCPSGKHRPEGWGNSLQGYLQ